ncbi:D-alanine--D-alanyl carrier protein ligase [Seminavis robusta]|uniref:D-alanine--D-alanyl carrier protein ligase n=1 Tax=Seminavis robusta TaxID=568900 RepID=A0A9N8EV06_9STRA|nr:D-alanine--D-alanyl carrier protein ligase [Seminavis robusta]|eukprot:Sro1903_g304510.1 D-alanine--D-alanyl carrier protein ligase (1356) ;mRNA; f:5409-9627
MQCFPTILKALNHHAMEIPDKVVFTWVDIKCEEQNKMTFKELEDQSNAVAVRLLKLGCKKGDRVMVAYPFGMEFLAGMFGSMKIGVIPCSIYPPNPNQLKTDMPKFRRFAEDAGAKFAISTSIFAAGMTAASILYKTGVKWIATDKLPIKKVNPSKPKDYEKFVGEPEDICFIQYTSGSTGHPKGVMITHNNLVETCKAGVALTDCLGPNDVEVLWVPQYHDMGLVTGFMGATYSGTPLVMASPLDFIINPLLWTDMVETYRATITCAPNFAYALLLKRLQQAKRTANWSCVKRAMFGGEPAQSHVIEAVSETLSIKPEHIYNNYGLAEAVVLLTGGPACPDAEGVVCCGAVDSPTLKLRIVEDGKEVEEGQVGCIWAQSPRVAAGYYGQPELTLSTFANALPGYDGIWLDTGDLGKVDDGQLYVTGRVKDVIIVNGKNYYPTDMELSVDETFGDIIRPGRTSAFQHGESSIGITVEGRKGFDNLANGDLAVQIANHVSQVHGIFVLEVVVLKLGATPKTTSGKLKRSEIRKMTLDGDWKESALLFQLQQNEMFSPLAKNDCPSQFATKAVGETPDGTQHEMMRHSGESESEATQMKPSIPATEAPTQKFESILLTILAAAAVDTSKTWAENGLTSLQSAELRNRLEQELHVVLPVNFVQLYPSPKALSAFLAASRGMPFHREAADNHRDFVWESSRSKLGKLQLGVLQTVGLIVILSLVLMSIIPSYFLVSWVLEQCDPTQVGECHGSLSWVLLPLSFPLYLLCFSVVVVICKYAVIGTYLQRQIELLSWHYLHWWFMDRLIEVWEFLVGQFVVETKYIWFFYWLLGADVAWSAKLDSYIREFDLVKVGKSTTIGHPVRCRKFSQSATQSPKVTFRPISFGENSRVFGMVSPGAIIGDGSKVEKLSSVDEGADVPNGVIARGSPACHGGSFEPSKPKDMEDSMLGLLKIAWTIFEAYHFFSLSYLVHAILNKILPSWRYAGMLHWTLLFPFTSFLALLTSIALKWILIGKPHPSDEYEGTLWRRVTNWACDFHFRIARWSFLPFFGGTSRIWNIILYLHGLDVDLISQLSFPSVYFLPSKVDFAKIRQSFVGTISLDLNQHADSKLEIVNSSVGYNANLHSGVKIVRSTIPPRSNVSESIYDLNPASQQTKPAILTAEVFYQLMNVIIIASIIPAYELLVWVLCSRMAEWILYKLPQQAQESFYGVCVNYAWHFRVGNLLELLIHGTPMFNNYARFMGAEVHGELWYFGNSLYDYGCLHFRGSVIVDDSHLTGHYVDHNGLTLGDTFVSGVVHPGCYAPAGSVVSGEESGPWRVFLGSDLVIEESKHVPKETHQGSSVVDSCQDDLMDLIEFEV